MRLWSMAPKGASVSGWRWLSPLARVPAALVWGCLLLTSWPLLALARRLLPPLLPEVLFCAPGAARRLALTIDDGPSPRSDQLLDLLRELQVPATLFLIGNHMWVDEVSARLDGAAFAAELRHTELALQVPMRWFRPGGGWFHRPMLRQLQAAGYRLALGSLFPLDTTHPPAWFLCGFLLLNAHPGGVIVLHDRPDTLPATLHTLRRVVPLLQRRGYRFVTLDGLERPGPARDPGEPA